MSNEGILGIFHENATSSNSMEIGDFEQLKLVTLFKLPRMSSQSHSKSNQLDLKITRISRFEFNSKGIFSSDTIVDPLGYLEMQQLGCSKNKC